MGATLTLDDLGGKGIGTVGWVGSPRPSTSTGCVVPLFPPGKLAEDMAAPESRVLDLLPGIEQYYFADLFMEKSG